MKVLLVPAAASEWQRSERLIGRVDLDPAADWEQEVADWQALLASNDVARILYGPDTLSQKMASALTRGRKVPLKSVDGLLEVDLGLWAGLTRDELKSRFATAHAALVDSPMSVSPPSGERFGEAVDRIQAALRKHLKKNARKSVAFVLRPFTLAIVNGILSGRGQDELWETARRATEPFVLEFHGVPVS